MELTAGYYKVDYNGSIIVMEYVGPKNKGIFTGTLGGQIIVAWPHELFQIIEKVL